MFERALSLPDAGAETFFLWGPRQAGKSTLLRRRYPDGLWFDLLKADEFRRYVSRPELLREDLEAADADPARQVVIDEVQKVPALLDEVHWLIENRGLRFALCGSSARKVRRGAANLLGGRALRYELRGLTAGEVGDSFDLDRALNHGYLPRIYESGQPRRLLDAYIADYLRQEVAAEGLVRNLPAFSEFLDAAALSDGEPVNYSSVARECGVSGPNCQGLLRHPGGHAAGALASRLAPTGQAPAPRCPEALLRGRGRGEPARAPRGGGARLRLLREGVRELGVP